MAKPPKALTEADFPDASTKAFRLIPTKENYLKPETKIYYRLIEFRADESVVCQPVGDDRYNYYLKLTDFDRKDSIAI